MNNKFINTILFSRNAILIGILFISYSQFLSATYLEPTKHHPTQQADQNPIDQYFQKIEIYPESGMLTKDGKIILQLKEKWKVLGTVVIQYGPEFNRQTKEINITSGLVEINDLGYNEYEIYLVAKDGNKIANSNFNLPLPSSQEIFKGKTNYLAPYKKYLSTGQLVVHDYIERNSRSASRSSQACNFYGANITGGYWYKNSHDNYPNGGGGQFFYLPTNCAAQPIIKLNCAYSPGSIGWLATENNATQWVERDPYAAWGAEKTQKLAYIYIFKGGMNNTAEDLMHCVTEGTQCSNIGIAKVNEEYQKLTIDGNLSSSIVSNGEIAINTNANWVNLPSGHTLTVCGGASATIEGDILKINGSGQKTVRLCTGTGSIDYRFSIRSVKKSNLLYLVSHNQVTQYFFGAKVRYASFVYSSVSCAVSISSQPENQSRCGSAPGTFCVEASGTGLSYQWQYSSNGSTLGGNATESTATQSCLTTSSGSYFRVRVRDNSGCEVYSNWVKFTSENVVINVTNVPSVCADDANFTLTNVSPSGGTFSGSGVNAAGLFNPATAGAGSHTINYTYTNNNNCTGATSFDITVEDCTPDCPATLPLTCEYRLQKQVDWISGNCNPTICADGRLELSVKPNTYVSYQWSGPNNFNGTGNSDGDILVSNRLMPQQAGTYSVTVTDTNGCTGTTAITIATKECPCNLSSSITKKTYLDNNTTNIALHTFSYDLAITGGGDNGWLMYDVVNGHPNQVIQSGENGETLNMGPFPVDQNGSMIIIMDADNKTCIQSIGVNMNSCIYTETCTCCK